MSPRISVVLATYQGESFVGEALESVLSQAPGPDEVIVCDDGSTDGTVEVVRGFGDRVQILRQANQGVSAARNRGAAEARGELLAFLDQDDAWEPELLATQTRALEQNPDWGLVYSDSWIVSNGRVRGRRGRHLPFAAGRVFERLLAGNFVPIETMLLRADLFRRVGGFRTDLAFLEDWELCLRAARETSLGFTPRPLARYRVHGDNLSHDVEGIVREYARILAELPERMPPLSESEGEVVERELDRRRAELAWHALRRLDVAEADRWLSRLRPGERPPALSKTRLLRALLARMPAPLGAAVVRLLPRQRLYGVSTRRAMA